MELFRKKNKRPDASPYPVKPVAMPAPFSPKMKVEEALRTLDREGAIYDVTFMGIRYQRSKIKELLGVKVGP